MNACPMCQNTNCAGRCLLNRRADPHDYESKLPAFSARVIGEMRNALILADHKAMNRRFDVQPITAMGEFA